MPTTIIAISSGNFDDRYISTMETSASAARNAETGTVTDNAVNHYAMHADLPYTSSIYVFRTMLSFDLSGESGTVISADLKVHSFGDSTGFAVYKTTGSTHVCKITPSSTDWVTGDFNSMDGWVSSGTYSGELTEYATPFTNVENSLHTVALNSDGLTAINSAIGSGIFHVALLNSADFTYDTSVPGLGDTDESGFINFLGLRLYVAESVFADSLKPQIELTFGSATPTYNSTIFGTNF